MRMVILFLTTALFLAAAHAAVPAAAETPGAAPADQPGSPDLEALAVEFVKQMADEDWTAATGRFDATMKSVAPPEKVREAWAGLIGGVGNFQRTGSIRVESFDPYHAVFVTCEFDLTELEVKVVFDPEQKISGFFFVPLEDSAPAPPPPYAKPATYREEDVTVGVEGWPLPATLTLPQGEGPFPAVVLVHGSGPQDRDETIGPNRPFRDLAWGLATQGVAVLRYEKRTKEHALRFRQEGPAFTVDEEVVADAVAAADVLRARSEIDGKQVFLLGHSLGGMLIPRIAAADDQTAGFISLAGATRPLEEVVVEQYEYLAAVDGQVDKEEQKAIDEIRRQTALLKSDDLQPDADPASLPFGVPAVYWLDLRGYDPAAEAVSITRPLLILQGERDYQVTMADYGRWKDALSDHANVEFRLYPTLNHLFMPGSGPSTPAEYGTPGHVAVEVVRDIAKWVTEGKL